MASTTSNLRDKHKPVILSPEQVRLLVEVVGTLELTYKQWHKVAEELNLVNARVAEAKFTYLVDVLRGIEKPKKGKMRKDQGMSHDEDDARPEWYKYLKKPQIKKTRHGNYNLDGSDGDFKEAEKSMTVDELLLVEREE